jgi:aminoglycoside phosphotransferase (APT) family kinase protein
MTPACHATVTSLTAADGNTLRAEIGTCDARRVDMHPRQLSVTVATVREVVDEQFPEWRKLPVRAIASGGTVHAIFRIGDNLVARFPLQGSDAGATLRSLEAEADAAGELLGRTRFPTPELVAIGAPGAGYPLPWSVQTWLPGVVATEDDPSESVALAHDLAEFVQGVRAIDTRGKTFRGIGRGGDLQSHDAWVETCLRESKQILDVPRLRRMWESMRELPRDLSTDVMTHGDLIPGNLLVSNSRLVGILDVGGLGPADPALDLVCTWHVFEVGPRQAFRDDLGCDDLEWERGKAWAFEQSIGAVWYYLESNQAMSRMGVRTLDRIMTEDPSA